MPGLAINQVLSARLELQTQKWERGWAQALNTQRTMSQRMVSGFTAPSKQNGFTV